MASEYPAEGATEQVEGATVVHHYLENKGVKIHYVETGKPPGQPVLLLHGWPEFWFSWAFQLKALADAGFHVIAMDLRGYNFSDKPQKVEEYGADYIMSDVREVVQALGAGKPVHVVAHDWGGLVAWMFTETYPELVIKLIQLNIPHPTVFGKALRGGNLRQIFRSWYMFLFGYPWLPEWLLSFNNYSWLKAVFKGTKVQTADFTKRHVDAQALPGALTGGLNYYRALSKGLWTRPRKEIRQPVKVIWGEDDTAMGKELAEPPKNRVPNQEVVFIPKASHWVYWDEPERVSEEILKFLTPTASS
ncbi:alpha/beta-Hydrolases superfamily protein [Klebsormidium nitens]|uniref:Alpha/beta-Hydrolases superfamily protein n=1 Tax=Klebsormidium nitens TaxID=105231 RepID=A0A1Y1HXC0_KLENI|nr:alpha/beta-Hydrolases superfamily protein [Klebsormidium nitens]|eukprot:GAQ83314.1 alpha/beta-Hydrolases superfamily protein [Klebsormidium nitens]